VGRRSRKASSTGPAAVTERPAPAPGPARRAAFWLIALALPFALLGVAELGLRLGGIGHDLEPLFVASPGRPQYLQANPQVVARFFTEPGQAPAVSIETAYFRKDKAPGTFRVFVQGESSAAGFPYGLGASLAGVLDQRFERAFPDREVEVISTAMAAVNSYALLDFADEILEQRPDAVVIYVGHNEFLGILGVGSTLRLAGSPWLTRAFLAVRDWRLFQLLARAHAAVREDGKTRTTASADTLMAAVAGERSIPLRSALFDAGREQFRRNLGALLGRYAAAKVPVFVGTLVSNERDQPPLAKLGGAEDERAGAAETAYYAARDADEAGAYDAARQGYAWARDLDPLRFRAPSAFNEVIAAEAGRHGAVLVDSHAAYVSASPNGLVGSTLLLEHVHPNLDGYFLLADAFFDAMLARGVPGAPLVEVPDERARAEMPVSAVDRHLGEYKAAKIRAAWPFVTASRPPVIPPPATEAERLAQEVYFGRLGWPEAHDALRRHFQATGEAGEFARTTGVLADAFPFVPNLQFEMAAALVGLSRPQDALRYANRGLEVEPRNLNLLLVAAHALALTGRPDEAKAALRRVLEIDPGNATATSVLRQLEGQ